MDAVWALVVHVYVAAPLAVSWRLSPAQSVSAPDGVMLTVGLVATLTVVLPLTCTGDAHAALDVTIQLTLAPLVSVELMNAGLLVPAALPLTCH